MNLANMGYKSVFILSIKGAHRTRENHDAQIIDSPMMIPNLNAAVLFAHAHLPVACAVLQPRAVYVVAIALCLAKKLIIITVASSPQSSGYTVEAKALYRIVMDKHPKEMTSEELVNKLEKDGVKTKTASILLGEFLQGS